MFCMIGSRTACRSRLGKALLSADKEECYHMLCLIIRVCLGRPDGEGGYLNQTAYLNKISQSPKMEQTLREGEIVR